MGINSFPTARGEARISRDGNNFRPEEGKREGNFRRDGSFRKVRKRGRRGRRERLEDEEESARARARERERE